MIDPKRHVGNLKLLGGKLCLDFINTLDWRGTDAPVEFLNTYADLITWAQYVGILTKQEAKSLLEKGSREPEKTGAILRRAVKLREAIYRIFRSFSESKSPSAVDLAAFNRSFSKTMGLSRITPTEAGLSWDSNGDKKTLDWMLNPVVRSTADLLVSTDSKRVKQCADAACGWLFLDTSRNRSRRWCDMNDCGNRAKANRFYRRKKEGPKSNPAPSET